jgi:hypothetical protein
MPALPPIIGAGDSWEPLAATFTCDRYGEVACTLTLSPPFARDPQAPVPGPSESLPGEGTMFADSIRLSIDGPIKTTHTFLPGIPVDVSAVEAAIGAGDPEALYAIDREYAPFWCMRCLKSYCRTCWTVWVDYDEGFYDCTRGRCPKDHVRVLDD